jgi:hypothetical protein
MSPSASIQQASANGMPPPKTTHSRNVSTTATPKAPSPRPSPVQAKSNVQYTCFIRLPFPRNGFEDPPPVEWDTVKDRALWKLVSKAANSKVLNHLICLRSVPQVTGLIHTVGPGLGRNRHTLRCRPALPPATSGMALRAPFREHEEADAEAWRLAGSQSRAAAGKWKLVYDCSGSYWCWWPAYATPRQ